MTKKKVSMTIDNQVFEDFRKYCQTNGMKISTKTEAMMKETMKNASLTKFMRKEK